MLEQSRPSCCPDEAKSIEEQKSGVCPSTAGHSGYIAVACAASGSCFLPSERRLLAKAPRRPLSSSSSPPSRTLVSCLVRPLSGPV